MTAPVVLLLVVPWASATPSAIRAAADRRGIRVVFVGHADAFDAGQRELHERYGRLVLVDVNDPEAAATRLAAERGDAVSTFSEGMVPATSRIAQRLGLAYHDAETTQALTDKNVQRRRLAAYDVDTVRSIPVSDRLALERVVSSCDWPVVVKPVRSQSSGDTYKVSSVEALPPGLKPSSEHRFVVEEYLEGRDCGELGDYVSVESVVVNGRPRTVGVTGKTPLLAPFRETGQFIPSPLSESEEQKVADLANRAAVALGVRVGLVHTEVKLTPGGPRVIEVNGRLGGWASDIYLRGRGIDLLEVGLAAAAGLPIDVPASGVAQPVEFQFWSSPPTSGAHVLAVHGVREVRQVEGVISYELRIQPGGEAKGGVGTAMLDFVRATARSHAQMLTMMDDVFGRLSFDFRFPSGETSTWRPTRSGLVRSVPSTVSAGEL